MPTDYEKLAADLLNGRSTPELDGKSDALKTLAGSQDAQRVKAMLGDGRAVKQAMETGDAAALQGIVKNVLGTKEGVKLAEELAKLFS